MQQNLEIACRDLWRYCNLELGQDKILSTGGEGGMVTTNNQELWSKMWR